MNVTLDLALAGQDIIASETQAFFPDTLNGDCLFAEPPEPFASGDPHVENIRGERFDIKRDGWHKLIQIPRFAPWAHRLEFRVDIGVEPRHDICGELYIQGVRMYGKK